MPPHTTLHQPWTCRWARFGQVLVPGRECNPTPFWSCGHPTLPDGAQLLAGETCSRCHRWAATQEVTPQWDGPGHSDGSGRRDARPS